jgi:hypothetical protein
VGAVIVEGDPVSGSDTHKVTGNATTPTGSVSYAGTATYPYDGTMTEQLSDFVTIGSAPVATVDSRSTLRAGHDATTGAPPFNPPATPALTPVPSSFGFVATVGTGAPTDGAGSSFVTVGGTAVLLDDDGFDTCGDERGSGNASVASAGQSVVTVAE